MTESHHIFYNDVEIYGKCKAEHFEAKDIVVNTSDIPAYFKKIDNDLYFDINGDCIFNPNTRLHFSTAKSNHTIFAVSNLTTSIGANMPIIKIKTKMGGQHGTVYVISGQIVCAETTYGFDTAACSFLVKIRNKNEQVGAIGELLITHKIADSSVFYEHELLVLENDLEDKNIMNLCVKGIDRLDINWMGNFTITGMNF